MCIERQLLEMISIQIQMLKPDSVPKPPYNTVPDTSASDPTQAASKTAAKGKQPASKTAGKGTASATTISSNPPPTKKSGRQLPSPPTHPPLSSRVSPYSPAQVSGVLVDAVKAGMSAQESAGVGGPGGAIGGGKGKRKVVRVRG